MTYYPGSSLLSLSSLSLSIHISIYLSSYLILSYSPSNPPTFCLSFSLLFYIPKFCLSHTNTSSLSIYISTHLPLPSIYLSIKVTPFPPLYMTKGRSWVTLDRKGGLVRTKIGSHCSTEGDTMDR